jgi:hypothetical protein
LPRFWSFNTEFLVCYHGAHPESRP